MVSVGVKASCGGKPLAVLQDLIQRRMRWLGESAKDAVIGSSVLTVRSLRADSRKAREKATDRDVVVHEMPWAAGWIRERGRTRRVVRLSDSPKAHRVPGVRPVNLAGQSYVPGEKVKCYRVQPAYHPEWDWSKNKNAEFKCWFVLSKSEKVAKEFGKRRIEKYKSRYSGLAKSAFGFMLSKLGRNASFFRVTDCLQGNVSVEFISGGDYEDDFTVCLEDRLEYAKDALRSGEGAVARAMMKASNQITGRIWQLCGHKLSERLDPPFPELVGVR